MTRITYVSPDESVQTFDVQAGMSVMDGAMNNGVDGILAECGGNCACATCQVYVDAAWGDRLEPLSDLEEAMLSQPSVPGRQLRLSCQIVVTDALEGLKLYIPDSQH